MEVITYGAGNMIELSLASDKSRGRVQYRLEWTKVDFFNEKVEAVRRSTAGAVLNHCCRMLMYLSATLSAAPWMMLNE